MNRHFSERLNQELDEMGVPSDDHERLAVLSKLLRIPRHKAQALLKGHTKPGDPLVESLAEELEVSPQWLLGTSNEKQH